MASRARKYRIAFVATRAEWELVRDAAAADQKSVASYTRAKILACAANTVVGYRRLREGVRAVRASPSQTAAPQGGSSHVEA